MRTLTKKIMLLMSLFMASTVFTACSSDGDDVNEGGQDIGNSSTNDGGTKGKCLCPAVSETNWLLGYINEKGQMVISPQFIYGEEFDASTGLARVYNTEGEMCFIDSLGNIKKGPASFDSFALPSCYPKYFFNGFALVRKALKWGLINTNFEYVIEPKYTYIRTMYTDPYNPSFVSPDGLVICRNEDNKYGCINTKGETVLDFKYDDLGGISENGLIACGTDVWHLGMSARSIQYRYIDKTGKTVIDSKYYDALEFHNGVALVNASNAFNPTNDKGMWGLINERGIEVVRPQYKHLAYISDDRYKFLEGYYYGIIDASGKEIIPATYRKIEDFTEGIAVATNEYGTQGYIDVNGNVVVDFIYKQASPLQNGYAAVTDLNDLSYIIDKSGNIIALLEKGEYLAYAHKNGLFHIISNDGKYEKYINLWGETVYSVTFPSE